MDEGCRGEILHKFTSVMMVAFFGAIEKSRQQETIRNLTSEVGQDYKDRFLIELLQNANDHSNEHGRISVILDLKTEPQVLYVANDGSPFTNGDFNDICDFAVSRKDPEKCIGNKGIGFRSVMSVTDRPIIYSVNPECRNAAGYCFTLTVETRDLIKTTLEAIREGDTSFSAIRREFGVPVQLDDLQQLTVKALADRLAVNPGLVTEVSAQLEPMLFPRLAPRTPETVLSLWNEGYVTVIALPLTKPDANKCAREALDALQMLDVLFLTRADRLSKAVAGDEQAKPVIITRDRSNEHLWKLTLSAGDSEPEPSGVYFHVRSWEVSGEELQNVQNSLSSSWKRISKATISLAVPAYAGSRRLPGKYSIGLPTEMPTGSALWVDTHFYGDISREHVNFGVDLNKYLLVEAATGVAPFLKALVEDGSIANSLAAVQALDFDSGGGPLAELLRPREPDDENHPSCQIQNLAIVHPYCGGNGKWLCLGQVRMPRTVNLSLLTAKAMSEHSGGVPHRTFLTEPHRESLVRASKSFGGGGEFSPGEMASVAESVAATLHSDIAAEKGKPSAFMGLYRDLMVLFPSDRTALKNRALLLASDCTLHKVGQPSPLVFELPQRTPQLVDAAALRQSLPRPLRQRICFMHQDAIEPPLQPTRVIAEYLRTGSARLIQQFDREELVNSALVPAFRDPTTTKDEKVALLRWSFQLWRTSAREFSAAGGGRSISWSDVEVPTQSGHWVVAPDVYFSSGWLDPVGRTLEEALEKQDKAKNVRHFLPPPAEFLDLVGPPDGLADGETGQQVWELFLRDMLLVSTAPRLIIAHANRWEGPAGPFRCPGTTWSGLRPRERLRNVANVPDAVWTKYVEYLEALRSSTITSFIQAERTFEIEHYVSIDGINELTPESARPYLRAAAANTQQYRRFLTCRVRRMDTGQISLIDSTLRLLLQSITWLPAEVADKEPYLASPDDILLVDAGELSSAGNQPLDAIPHLPRDLAAQPQAAELAQLCGVASFDDMDLRTALRWLEWLQETATPDMSTRVQGLWHRLLERAGSAFEQSDETARLAVKGTSWCRIPVAAPETRRVQVWTPSDAQDGAQPDTGPVYVPDEPKFRPILDGKVAVAEIGPRPSGDSPTMKFLLHRFGTTAVQLMSAVSMTPYTGSRKLDSEHLRTARPLREVAGWLETVSLAVLAYGRPQTMKLEKGGFRDYVSDLTGLRVLTVSDLRLGIPAVSEIAMHVESFAWHEMRTLVVDDARSSDLMALLNGIGDYLVASDFAGAAAKHLYRLDKNRNLGLGPGSGLQQGELGQLLAQIIQSRADLDGFVRRIHSIRNWVLDSIMPAILARAPGGALPATDMHAAFLQHFDPEQPGASVDLAWHDTFSSPAPPEFAEFVRVAAESPRELALAEHAFRLLGVTLSEWNRCATLIEPDHTRLRNQAAMRGMQEKHSQLDLYARALLRMRLVETHKRHRLEACSRSLSDIVCPPSVSENWRPSLRELIQPLVNALAEAVASPSHEWCSVLLPVHAEETDTQLLARLAAAGLDVDHDEEACLQTNMKVVRELVGRLKLLVLARWRKTETEKPAPQILTSGEPYFQDDDVSKSEFRSDLRFEVLKRGAILARVRDAWAQSSLAGHFGPLPVALDLADLQHDWGLTDEDVVSADEVLGNQAAQEHRRRNTHKILGEDYFDKGSGNDPFDGLSDHIDAHLTPDFGSELDPTSTVAASPASPGSSVGKTQTDSRHGHRRPLDRTLQLLGATGEREVYRALCAMLRRPVPPTCWKSKNRRHFILDGDDGDDNLGFDFDIQIGDKRYLIEVKTKSESQPDSIDLGQSEVAAARKHRSEAEAVWRIWLVTEPFNSKPGLYFLGNPFRDEHAHGFTIRDRGAIVQFRLPGQADAINTDADDRPASP